MSPEYAKSSEMKSLEKYLSLLEDDSRRQNVTDSLEEIKKWQWNARMEKHSETIEKKPHKQQKPTPKPTKTQPRHIINTASMLSQTNVPLITQLSNMSPTASSALCLPKPDEECKSPALGWAVLAL